MKPRGGVPSSSAPGLVAEPASPPGAFYLFLPLLSSVSGPLIDPHLSRVLKLAKVQT